MSIFPEKRLIEAYVIFTIAAIFTTPSFALFIFLFVASPAEYFNANNWLILALLSIPALLLIIIPLSTALRRFYKWIAWGTSSVFWGGCFVFLLQDSSTFTRPWLVWFPHLLLALISALMVIKLGIGDVSNKSIVESNNSASSMIVSAVLLVVLMIILIVLFNGYISFREESCEQICSEAGLEYSYSPPNPKEGKRRWDHVEADECVCQ